MNIEQLVGAQNSSNALRYGRNFFGAPFKILLIAVNGTHIFHMLKNMSPIENDMEYYSQFACTQKDLGILTAMA